MLDGCFSSHILIMIVAFVISLVYSAIAFVNTCISWHIISFFTLLTGFDLNYFKRNSSAGGYSKPRYKSLSAGHNTDGLGELKNVGLAQKMTGRIRAPCTLFYWVLVNKTSIVLKVFRFYMT